MDFPLRKSVKSHGSYRHMRRISAGGGSDSSHEEQPISLNRDDHHSMGTVDSADRREVIVKIDSGDTRNHNSSSGDGGTGCGSGGGRKIWRESSYQFWKDDEGENAG
ncbi:hypothetical protein L1049_014528 [Liquidambar formosana]|uniref:Uncharacterized protein n=1 Tax=Liquidambar formosana TaxID=63359 RepID=A0AAP0RWH5_LIQFO